MTYAMPELMLRHTQSCTCTFCCTIKDFDTIIMFYLQPITSNHKEKRYFGNISRSEAEAKCCKPGDYLVRYSSNLNKHMLTVMNGRDKIDHIIIVSKSLIVQQNVQVHDCVCRNINSGIAYVIFRLIIPSGR